MVQYLRALAVLPKDLSSIPSIHVTAHIVNSSSRGSTYLLLVSTGISQAYSTHTDMKKKPSYTENFFKKLIFQKQMWGGGCSSVNRKLAWQTNTKSYSPHTGAGEIGKFEASLGYQISCLKIKANTHPNMGEQLLPADKKTHTQGLERWFNVESTCSYRGPGLHYHHRHGGSQQAVMTIPEDPMPPSEL